jgi:hypothetical protein
MRNFDCPSYDACLSRAAMANSPGFDCAACPHVKARAPREEFDIISYHLLLRAIFRPDLYARYRGAKGVRKPRLNTEMACSPA